MGNRGGGSRSRRSLAALVASSLVARDVPDADPLEIEAATEYVDECLDSMPDITRAGVAVASGLAAIALGLLGRAPYRRQSAEARSASAARLAGVSFPVLSEFTRLTRGLALVGLYDQRSRRAGPA